jgi:hypothetical protein
MRRALVMIVAAFTLGGCSSFSMDSFNYFKSTPTTVQVQLESTPPGADARTSIGPGCKTPCAVTITPPEAGFTVSYTIAGREPASVPVQVVREAGGTFSADTFKISPNPVFAELRPAGPPPKAAKPMRPKRRKPAPAADAAPADAGAAAAPQR